jgi:hypothetical protein
MLVYRFIGAACMILPMLMLMEQSIHGMSSVLAGIPSFKDAFTSSPYPKQRLSH